MIYLTTADGKRTPFVNLEEFNAKFTPAPDNGNIKSIGKEFTGTATVRTYIDRNLKLSLIYGRKITNNWLKMHGGIMTRRALQERRTRKRNKKQNRRR